MKTIRYREIEIAGTWCKVKVYNWPLIESLPSNGGVYIAAQAASHLKTFNILRAGQHRNLNIIIENTKISESINTLKATYLLIYETENIEERKSIVDMLVYKSNGDIKPIGSRYHQ